jgi:adenosylmethionine-8-amino-7-oxononanoate aminotransferase
MTPSHVFHRSTSHSYPLAVGGEGAYLIDSTGRRYLDAAGGAAVSCLGHGDPEVTAAIIAQLQRLAYAHTMTFTNEPMEELADLLAAQAPARGARALFVSSGSEAVEAAIKLARQYHVERGEPARTRLIARRQSYAGNTLGALAAGGNPARRQLYGPLLQDVALIAPCYPYREQRPDESATAYGRRAADELEAAILAAGPGQVMAFIAETVAGASLGCVPPAPGYLARIREICDQYGVLLILDEVMCGMGRTGTLFACEQEGVAPDIVCVAKGLGAGYQPIGAAMCSAAIYDTIAAGSGALAHGHTYMGHPVACAAALAVQRAVRERGLLARVRDLGADLERRLRAAFASHPHVGDIRGRGLFWALELVADRESKRPFDPARRIYAQVKAAALRAGLLCYPMGGTVDGFAGDHVILAPPYTIAEVQLDEMVAKLAAALASVLAP